MDPIYGPVGKHGASDQVDGWRMAPVEHILRLDFAFGGRETGLDRALNTLRSQGEIQWESRMKQDFQKALDLLDPEGYREDPIRWDAVFVVENDAQYEDARRYRDVDDIIYRGDIGGSADPIIDFSVFGIDLPQLMGVMNSPSGSVYGWFPTDPGCVICGCPSKVWQWEQNILCKHEIAALVAMHEGSYSLDETQLPSEYVTLIAPGAFKKYTPSSP